MVATPLCVSDAVLTSREEQWQKRTVFPGRGRRHLPPCLWLLLRCPPGRDSLQITFRKCRRHTSTVHQTGRADDGPLTRVCLDGQDGTHRARQIPGVLLSEQPCGVCPFTLTLMSSSQPLCPEHPAWVLRLTSSCLVGAHLPSKPHSCNQCQTHPSRRSRYCPGTQTPSCFLVHSQLCPHRWGQALGAPAQYKLEHQAKEVHKRGIQLVMQCDILGDQGQHLFAWRSWKVGTVIAVPTAMSTQYCGPREKDESHWMNGSFVSM